MNVRSVSNFTSSGDPTSHSPDTTSCIEHVSSCVAPRHLLSCQSWILTCTVGVSTQIVGGTPRRSSSQPMMIDGCRRRAERPQGVFSQTRWQLWPTSINVSPLPPSVPCGEPQVHEGVRGCRLSAHSQQDNDQPFSFLLNRKAFLSLCSRSPAAESRIA